jgi:hypothetical protein
MKKMRRKKFGDAENSAKEGGDDMEGRNNKVAKSKVEVVS